jgi:integrase
LNRAEKWEIPGARNVVRMTDPPHAERRLPSFLNPQQARDFLEAARGDRLEALYTVALTCGLRAGEVRALRWQDVDIANNRLRIDGTLQEAKGPRYWIGPPKSKSAYRAVALSRAAAAALLAHYEKQFQEKTSFKACGLPWGNEWELVFTTAGGRPLSKTTFRANFRRVVERARLRQLRFHDLRHSCASLLFSQGVGARDVSDLLGHSDVRTTLDLYTHLIPPARTDTAETFDRLLEAGEPNGDARSAQDGRNRTLARSLSFLRSARSEIVRGFLHKPNA